MTGLDRNQSYVSNELTHFVGRHQKTDDGRFALLCKIIRNGNLRGGGADGSGQGNMELDFQKALTSNALVSVGAVCFCDIPLDCLNIHMGKYSRFGLAFSKNFMRHKGCNPVYYVSKHSPCTDHRYGNGAKRQQSWGDFFEAAFRKWLPSIRGKDPTQLSRIENLTLWYVLGHLKFFDITLEENDPDNYYMEREWRIIGSMGFDRDDIARVILPRDYVSRFRKTFPNFGQERIHEV